MLIDIIAGARPNFIKIAPIISVIQELNHDNFNYRLIHTGQHYDKNMSDSFFQQLSIPMPDHNLECGGGTQSEQTAAIMIRYENLLEQTFSPNLCLVVGDVNSTMACAIVARKMGIPVAHVEAGIRSHDWTMPEEINRVVTDSITNYYFTTSRTATANLIAQGASQKNIFFVGNTMIDTLLKFKSRFKKPSFWTEFKLISKEYLLITLHRPANVDNETKMRAYLEQIIDNSNDLKLVFPVHPRTKKIIDKLKINHERLFLIEPLGYLEFNYLTQNAFAVITDSGGITEEATVLGVPCVTLRDNTERPETVSIGTNLLIGTDPGSIKPVLEKLFSGDLKKGRIPELWDGLAARRIINILKEIM